MRGSKRERTHTRSLPIEASIDSSGRHRTYGYAAADEFLAQRLTKSPQAEFRGTVSSSTSKAHMIRIRRNINEPTVLKSLHSGKNESSKHERCCEIHR